MIRNKRLYRITDFSSRSCIILLAIALFALFKLVNSNIIGVNLLLIFFPLRDLSYIIYILG